MDQAGDDKTNLYCGNYHQECFKWLFLGFMPKALLRIESTRRATDQRKCEQSFFRYAPLMLDGCLFVEPKESDGG